MPDGRSQKYKKKELRTGIVLVNLSTCNQEVRWKRSSHYVWESVAANTVRVHAFHRHDI